MLIEEFIKNLNLQKGNTWPSKFNYDINRLLKNPEKIT
jgi:hypothetical protein